jgi:hypothetical protein
MSEIKTGAQKGSGRSGGVTHPTTGDSENDRGAEFGTSERATRGTNRDADETGTCRRDRHLQQPGPRPSARRALQLTPSRTVPDARPPPQKGGGLLHVSDLERILAPGPARRQY